MDDSNNRQRFSFGLPIDIRRRPVPKRTDKFTLGIAIPEHVKTRAGVHGAIGRLQSQSPF